MVDDLIPEEIRQFITEHIASIAQLEALLLLYMDASVNWTVLSVAKRLYISEREAKGVLTKLCASGLLVREQPEAYRYKTSSPELNNLTDRLIELYRKHLIPVTNLIHATRKSRIQQFADAFKLRKDG